MAQAFVSTYKNHFRWSYQPRVPLYDATKLTKLQPEGDIWMLDLNKEIDEELEHLPDIEAAIHKLYLRRMRSTYQVSYCDNLAKVSRSKKSEALLESKSRKLDTEHLEKEDELENELLEQSKKLYDRKIGKITPPLDTARNVFGYMRPTRLLTPLTIYQNEYGKLGYNILKSDYLQVKSVNLK